MPSSISIPYFSQNYSRINLPISEGSRKGLRNAQIGAIHAIGSHFTLYSKEPALVVMPTGSGKTAVLILAAFLQRASRVLVISSNVLVRGQIVHEFKTLETLKNSNVFHRELECPRVFEMKGPIKSREEWDKLIHFDVVVGIPNSINAGICENFHPENDLFDLILVDEAHHTPAFTWSNTINTFPLAQKIYFTATPFRRDKKEIEGRIAYNYPLSRAYEDQIFGDVGYYPVTRGNNQSNDLAVAKKTEEIFNQDREANLDHFLLVRTDSKDHADSLEKLYAENTALNLKKVHSRLSFRTIQKTISDLKDKKLDGIICVNMLGEGFDFPNLKIAAVHAPQKSLAATLQFIGRFARTNAENIGQAKFIALEHDIKIRNEQLYKEDAVWNDIIRNLSEDRIIQEDNTKTVLDTFEQTDDGELRETKRLSLYNLNPYCHVKIYRVNDFQNDGIIELANHEIVNHFISEANSTVVFITKERLKPKWLISDELVNVKYHLFMIYYDIDTSLLFIHSSIKTSQFYDDFVVNFCNDEPSRVPKSQIHKVLSGLENTRIFNLGLQNRSSGSGESYITKAGPDTQNTVTASDGRMYSNGHIFGTAESEGTSITIGYSSGAKVWSNAYLQIPNYIEWCKIIGRKIVSNVVVRTNSGFDNIPVPKTIDSLGTESFPYCAIWHRNTYAETPELIVRQEDELIYSSLLSETEIIIKVAECDATNIVFDLVADGYSVPMKFSFENHYELRASTDYQIEIHLNGGEIADLIDYFNFRPLKFYMTDFSTLVNHNELIESPIEGELPFDREQIIEFPWDDFNADITKEFGRVSNSNKISIHDTLRDYLKNKNMDVLIYDHGTGEMADFIVLENLRNEIKVELYHVKAAGGNNPSDRVNDVYEVCGQANKSLIWTTNRSVFKSKMANRTSNNGDKFILGDFSKVNEILNEQKVLKFHIIIVQPGISRGSLTEKIGTVLAATDDFVRKNGNNEVLKILGSPSTS